MRESNKFVWVDWRERSRNGKHADSSSSNNRTGQDRLRFAWHELCVASPSLSVSGYRVSIFVRVSELLLTSGLLLGS